MPVLQGWTAGDYWRCADRYDRAGVRLEDYPVVGLGSVCRHSRSFVSVSRSVGSWRLGVSIPRRALSLA
jgi:hypothetical protein